MVLCCGEYTRKVTDQVLLSYSRRPTSEKCRGWRACRSPGALSDQKNGELAPWITTTSLTHIGGLKSIG